MSINTWGWGSCGVAIGTFGWGGCPCLEYIPSILAEFLGGSKAYSCIITRKYIQLKSRTTGKLLLRMKPDALPQRIYSELVKRSENAIEFSTKRSTGWPRESNIICED